ncbi:MAG: NAD(P)H-binding protein [Cloacibacterium sp.]|nr:NAD(P)H-binding protein [Cloacibacterium sp.]
MKALVIGATGATGKDLVKCLLEDSSFSEVHIFVRRSVDISNPKLKIHTVDFDKIQEWKDNIVGDVAFSVMGTTLKQAGSKEVQRVVDYNYPYNFAKYAKENNVPHFVLLSSYGANSNSIFFYNKIKGELENAIQKLNFEYLTIFQPGVLERKNSDRLMEVIASRVIKFINNLGLFVSQKPMPTEILAQAMINSAQLKTEKISFIKLNKIFETAKV